MMSARLKAIGIESIVLDRNAQIGDNWANRYDSLKFHVPTSCCEMPYACMFSYRLLSS
jgi:cation diffusion facilitator CzcD-associated flavoprotein CzcO